MRYFIGCVVILTIMAGCSSTEPLQQQESRSEEPIEKESPIPSWYSAGTHSSSDSLSLHGYALASAMDSSRAVELSIQTALEYLRFEIDQTAEEVRKELAESSAREKYGSSAFIIRLRNSVSNLSLDSANITLEHESTTSGIHYNYAKASIGRTELPELLRTELSDQAFLQEIGFSFQ